jgi:hypothetical protein
MLGVLQQEEHPNRRTYSILDVVYRTASGGGASIVDKFSERKSSLRNKIEKQNRGCAVPQRVKGYPPKLDQILS